MNPFNSKSILSILTLLLAATATLAENKIVRGEDFVTVPANSESLCVSNAFQSHMVLQRDKEIKIWGWATPNEPISVSFAGQSTNTSTSADRSWQATLPALPANNTPQTLKIQGNDQTLELENILIGDVWILGGQSNMEFPISKVDEGALEIVSANFPQIRLLTIPQGKGFDSIKSFERLHEWSGFFNAHFPKGDWEVCSPQTITEFSAIGYIFGRRLAMATGIPIGLIDASVGGTTVETWTPQDRLAQINGQETRDLLQQWNDKIAAYDPQADLDTRIAKFENDKQKRAEAGNPLPADSQAPTDLRPGPAADRNRPGYCYASMIRPLEGLAIKGAVFHQGFNNCFNGSPGARMYQQVFGEMITSWRTAFNNAEMPFCIISLCTAGDPQTQENFLKPMYDVGPLIREAQYQTFLTLHNAGDQGIGFASSFDLRKSWYHPQIKVPAGERAAKWALASHYEILNDREAQLYWLPPSITEVNAAEGKIHLKLNTEVKTADDSDGKMLGFAIAGSDKKFYPAHIDYGSDGSVDDRNRPRFQKNTLVLSSPYVPQPTHFRYAWARNPMANIVNKFGVPLATQRSDDWILEELGGAIAPEKMDPNSAQRWLRNANLKILEQADIKRRVQEAEATLNELRPILEKAAAEKK